MLSYNYLPTIVIPIALIVVAGNLSGQDEPPPRGWLHSIGGGYLYQAGSDLGETGDFSLDQFSLQYGLSNFLPDGNIYGISLNYSWWGYDFNGSHGLGSGDPWENISMVDFGVPLFYHLTETWDLFAVPTLRSTFENGAGLSDGITAGGLFGLSRTFNESLTIGPGFGLYSELEEGATFFPFAAITWKLDDFWSVESGRGLGVSSGPAIFANYDLDKHLRFQFGGRYESRRFRLDDEGIAPGGVGEDTNFSFYAGVRYSPTRSMQFSAFAGYKFSGELILDGSSGHRLERQSYNGAFHTGVSFKVYLQ